jgi:hypothetical protein
VRAGVVVLKISNVGRNLVEVSLERRREIFELEDKDVTTREDHDIGTASAFAWELVFKDDMPRCGGGALLKKSR